MNHITTLLNNAGLLPRVRTVETRQEGYTVSEWGGVIAIHCKEDVTPILFQAGLAPYVREGSKAVYVSGGA